MLQIPPEMLTWRRTPYLRELENTYEAGRFLDTGMTFVTEKQILDGKLSRFKLLIVPAASHIRAEVVASILRFVDQGGNLFMLPSSFLSDEYNRPAPYLSDMGVRVRRIEQVAADRTGELEQGYDQTYHERVVFRPSKVQPLSTRGVGLFAKSRPDLQVEGTRQDISLAEAYDLLAVFPDDQPALVSFSRGRGRIYYSATSFPRRSLGLLLDLLFEAAAVSRPVRVRGEHGEALWNVEARFVGDTAGKLLYIVNFNDNPVSARIEMTDGRPRGFYDLRKQEKLVGNLLRVLPGETSILRLDRP